MELRWCGAAAAGAAPVHPGGLERGGRLRRKSPARLAILVTLESADIVGGALGPRYAIEVRGDVGREVHSFIDGA